MVPLPLPLTDNEVTERLGPDEYSFIITSLCSSSDIEEKNLLDRSFADYFEGSDSVIVKGSLRVNTNFGKGLVLYNLFLVSLEMATGFLFNTPLLQFFFAKQ